MFLNGKEIFDLKEDDLLSLINKGESEIKTLEFKRTLVIGTDADKKEFLADVSSFANAAGGYIIYGMDAKDGIATALPGMNGINLDEMKLRIENIIREGISPRISNIAIHPIQLKSGTHAIVLYIPKSWASPHTVWFQKSSKFFSRNSAGKYQLDIQEIRSAFTLSETLNERIKNFRLDRVSKIHSDDTPIALNKGGKSILHLIPVASFQTNQTIDLPFVAQNYHKLRLYGGVAGGRYNFDGFLAFARFTEGYSDGYIQIFRNGIVEIVDAYLLQERENTDHRTIPSVAYEKLMVESCAAVLNLQDQLDIEPPLFISHSITGVAGYEMAWRDSFWQIRHAVHPIDRDILLIPEISVEDRTVKNVEVILRPIFDAAWNAAGFERSMNYDANGQWLIK